MTSFLSTIGRDLFDLLDQTMIAGDNCQLGAILQAKLTHQADHVERTLVLPIENAWPIQQGPSLWDQMASPEVGSGRKLAEISPNSYPIFRNVSQTQPG